MTFRSDNQPNHDRAVAARKARTPWRNGNHVSGNTVKLRRKWAEQDRKAKGGK